MAGRRPYGTGTLYVKAGSWYGRWLAGERRVNRCLGPIRQPGSREGLTRAQAERELRRRMEQDQALAATTARLTVEEAGERLIDHLEATGRKKSTIEGYRSALNVHLAPYFGREAARPDHPRGRRALLRPARPARRRAEVGPELPRGSSRHL